MTNQEIADLLRSVAAAYSMKGLNRFQIIAYEGAADGIEHATSDVTDLWKHEGKEGLKQIPGIGEGIAVHLDELFRTGQVAHFEDVLKDYPEGLFSLLKVPGVGPKTALKLVELGVDDLRGLKNAIQDRSIEGKVTDKLLMKLREGLEEYQKRSDRMLLPMAEELADIIVGYLTKAPFIRKADPLGSLRRKVSTIGDIDIAVASDDIKKVKAHLLDLPILGKILEEGETTLTLVLKNGIRVDIMVQPLTSYGALIQHFTGSKHHNIKLRSYANKRGFSLSEHGIKEIKSKTLLPVEDEGKIYELLGMQVPPPEIREDTGEIEAAIDQKLPVLVALGDIKGDVHTHTTWSDGHNSVSEMAEKAKNLGYKYMAITDHSYPNLDFSKRIKQIEQYNDSENGIRVIIGLEVNITASCGLQVSNRVLSEHEFILASIHSSFRQDKETITKRLVYALEHPLVNGIAHPTGRILLERSGYEADWEKVFEACLKYDKFLEINSFPDRMDLPDILVREAVGKGVKLVVNTDSHHLEHMTLMKYGVGVARRGWTTKKSILNALDLPEFVKEAHVRLRK